MASTSGLGASLADVKTDLATPAVAVNDVKTKAEGASVTVANNAAETTLETTKTTENADKPTQLDAPADKTPAPAGHEETNTKDKEPVKANKKEEEKEEHVTEEEEEEEASSDEEEYFEEDDLEEYFEEGEDSGTVNLGVFGQLLEMDDDEVDRAFSKSIVINFFEQAQTTFDDMDKAILKRDLDAYAKLGHFLKGSSATLGLQKVGDTCEKIQHCQASADEVSLPEIDDKAALARGSELLEQLKDEYHQAERFLCRFYRMPLPPATVTDA